MIAVTGGSRSGTSLMMQTLKILGIPVIGEKFGANTYIEGNPKGYWEPSADISNEGVHEPLDGAIKLFGYSLYKSNQDCIDHVIMCTRDESDAIKSTIKWMEHQEVPGLKACEYNARFLHIANLRNARAFLDETNKPFVEVKFEDITTNPKKVISKIVGFLGLKASDEIIKEAIDNVEVR